MSTYDYGPLEEYEVTWTSGHVEHIQAHQVTLPQPSSLFLESIGGRPSRQRYTFHGMFDGKWRLVLDAAEEDITRVRNVTHTEEWLRHDP